MRSDCTGKVAASETLALAAKRPLAVHTSFYEGRGPPIKGGLRSELWTTVDHGSPSLGDGWSAAVPLMEGRGPRSLRSGLRPDPRRTEAERRASDKPIGRIADFGLLGTSAQGRGR